MSLKKHQSIIDESIITLCKIKEQLHRNEYSEKDYYKLEYLQRMARCYNAIFNHNQDDLDLHLLIILKNSDNIHKDEVQDDSELQNVLQTTYNKIVYLRSQKDMIAVKIQ